MKTNGTPVYSIYSTFTKKTNDIGPPQISPVCPLPHMALIYGNSHLIHLHYMFDIRLMKNKYSRSSHMAGVQNKFKCIIGQQQSLSKDKISYHLSILIARNFAELIFSKKHKWIFHDYNAPK